MGGDGGTTTAAGLLLLLLLAASTHTHVNACANGVTPRDPYVYIGDNLTLTCELNLTLTCNFTESHNHENASSMFFTWGKGDTAVDAKYITKLSPTSIQLTKPVRGSQDEGNYVCWVPDAEKVNNKSRVGFQIVGVDHKPEPVKNISCIVDDWWEMYCSWTLGQSYIHPEHINVSLVWNNSYSNGSCPEMNTTWCKWSCDHFLTDVVYNMTVVVKNKRTKDSASSEVFTIKSQDLVKARPVEMLEVSGTNSTCLNVSWQSSNQHREQFVYHLTYEALATCEGGKAPHTQAEETKWLDTKATLCGLTPFTCYEVKVAAMPVPTPNRETNKTAGFLSSWRTVKVTTSESLPVRAPPMDPGGFMQTSRNETHRTVTVYWKPVEKKDLHGKLTGYTLTYVPMSKGESKPSTEKVSAYSLSKELTLPKDQAYRVWLFARNGVGLSILNSTIVIPEWQGEEVEPRDIVVQAEESGNPRRFYIQWQPPTQGDVRSYAVFWCRGDRASLKCQDEINWKPLDKSQTSTEVNISATAISTDSFLFGVSAEVEMEASSVFSGIVWGTCNYVKGRVPDERPRGLRIISRLPDPGLTVDWEGVDCPPTRSYVSRYLLSYCTVNTRNKCTEPPVRVNVSRKSTSHVMEKAEAGQRYMVQVQPWNPAGSGPVETGFHLYRVSTSNAHSGETLGIIISALFLGILLLVAGFILLIRKFRKMKTKCSIEIVVTPGPDENANFDHMDEGFESESDSRQHGRNTSVDSETALIDSEVAFDRRSSTSGTKSRGPAPPRPTPPSSGSHPSGNSYIRQGYLSNGSSQPVVGSVEASTVPDSDTSEKQGYCSAMPDQPALNPQPQSLSQDYCSAMPDRWTLNPQPQSPSQDYCSAMPDRWTLNPQPQSPSQGYCSAMPDQPALNPQPQSPSQVYCSAMPDQPTLNPQPHSPPQDYCSAMPDQPTLNLQPHSQPKGYCSAMPDRSTLNPKPQSPSQDYCSAMPDQPTLNLQPHSQPKGYCSAMPDQPTLNPQPHSQPKGYCSAMPHQPTLNPQPQSQLKGYCTAMPGQHPFKMSPPTPIPKTAPTTDYRRQESIPLLDDPWVPASTSSTPGQTVPSAPSTLASTSLLQRSTSSEDDVPQLPTLASLGYVQQGQLPSFHCRV